MREIKTIRFSNKIMCIKASHYLKKREFDVSSGTLWSLVVFFSPGPTEKNETSARWQARQGKDAGWTREREWRKMEEQEESPKSKCSPTPSLWLRLTNTNNHFSPSFFLRVWNIFFPLIVLFKWLARVDGARECEPSPPLSAPSPRHITHVLARINTEHKHASERPRECCEQRCYWMARESHYPAAWPSDEGGPMETMTDAEGRADTCCRSKVFKN